MTTSTVVPRANDVLFGRGNPINKHPGNQRYRAMVDAQKPQFARATKRKDKRAIATSIMRAVHALRPPGRFLVEDREATRRSKSANVGTAARNRTPNDAPDGIHPKVLEKVWIPVENDKALDKIFHRLREKEKGEAAGSRGKAEPSDGGTLSGGSANESFHELSDCTEDQLESWALESEMGEALASNGSSASAAGDLESEAGEEPGGNDNGDASAAKGSSAVTGNLPKDAKEEEDEWNSLLQSIRDVDYDPDETDLADELVSGQPPQHGLEALEDEFASLSPNELTLYQWIARSKSKLDAESTAVLSSDDAVKYVESALPVALKLTGFLIEAEKEEAHGQGNAIPLASIDAGNVLIRAGGDGREAIEYAWILSPLGDDPRAGEIARRLFALGTVLYQLFVGEEIAKEDLPVFDPSVSSIDLSQEDGAFPRPPKKTEHQRSHADDKISRFISKMESNGIPWSICSLVRNLLDCCRCDFCGDEAYASLADLQADLQLMLEDPARFLCNLSANPLPQMSIPDKLYGRTAEVTKLESAYAQHVDKKCSGVLISGGAGVGKSKLARHVVRELTSQSEGYFLAGKFDQNNDVQQPLAVLGSVFNTLCLCFARDTTPSQLSAVDEALGSALGDQASLLARIVPGLSQLMPSCIQLDSPDNCVNSALSIRFLFCELLQVLALHSKPITLFLDDIQWADPATTVLVADLLAATENKPVFFVFCYRDDDEVAKNAPFNAWLSSISRYSLESITLENVSVSGVNQLVSDTLHTSPRITRPLSAVLYHKTGGNALFLKQLMELLREQGLIYLNLSPPRWAWDMDKIANLELSDDVVSLLIDEIQKLPSDLQLGLKVASCLGSRVPSHALDVLSKDLSVDLTGALQRVAEKGFMDGGSGDSFAFAHDKIQQAAAALMTEQERRESHMRYGLALCTHAMDNNAQDDGLFFVAVNQINSGGPTVVEEPSQRSIIAALNLKAGRRAMKSDYDTAFHLFVHGISFLDGEHWTTHYQLSIDLYDSAAEAACSLNKSELVTFYSEQVVAHAHTFDDKLNALWSVTKSLRHDKKHKEAMNSTFSILAELGEELPREKGEDELNRAIQAMDSILLITPDDAILQMGENTNKKIVALLKLYASLAEALLFVRPSLVGPMGIRMADLTMKTGLSAASPLAFSNYGILMISIGRISDGCRFARLALKLSEKPVSSALKSSVINWVCQMILWAAEPFQSLVDSHLLGVKAGRQSGDVFKSMQNWILSIELRYLVGQNVNIVSSNLEAFMQQGPAFHNHPIANLVYLQIAALRDGHPALEEGTEKNPLFFLAGQSYRLMRAFLLHQHDGLVQHANISEVITNQKHHQRPLTLLGIFYEGLASFRLARQQSSNGVIWVRNGDNILAKAKFWHEHSAWNWENKMLLLEAEKMHTCGIYESAASLYEQAMRSAREHKFPHEEGIAAELAAEFFYQRGLHEKALDFWMHSVRCYEQWGALAVVKRVQADMARKFGSYYLLGHNDNALDYIFASHEGATSKKRDAGA